MKPHNITTMLGVAAMLGNIGLSTHEAKQPRKCRLKDCQQTTIHNGGYCCAKHCKLDRELNKTK